MMQSMQERYKEFYNTYKNKLFSYLLYLNGDPETSKDIMQESFTRHFKHYGNDASISATLLYTIARNALTDERRLQNRFTDRPEVIEQTTGDEESSLLIREKCKNVTEAMGKLSRIDQEILVLAVGGMSYKEISNVLGMSESNIKVRIHRARTKLRQMLNQKEVP